ncbi:disease resistance protein [Quercus suber]|uniref:Disease resistance protein n=1 Tax=Quercus suber TaxID=58331 RepID=A0AAW0KR82_QUESU
MNLQVAFPSLETLCLLQCMLEDIAIIGELRNLEILILLHPNVEQLPREIGLLTRLRILNLNNCTKLKVSPPNVLSCLIQLEELYVGNSFTQWDVEGLNNERASLAELKHLSRLTSLEVDIPDANMLPKDLLFEKLQRYKIFVGDTKHSRALKLKLNTISSRYNKGTLFPNLEVLRSGGNYKMKEIQRDQLFEECLYKLKVLHVIDYVAVSDWITFLKRLHSLEKLFVNSSSWEEIFPYKELFDMENHATILPKLRELEFYEQPMLTHLWKEDTQPSPMFHNLENLKVLICHKLKNFVPSSVSFQNLTNLEICKCHGLINLVTSSTAKSLVQLKKMSVSECERMTEAVTGEGGEASEFPSLEEVIVRQCPEMKTFSHGALGTPKLERVQATQEDEWHWKANLNTTIHWLWESKHNTTIQ